MDCYPLLRNVTEKCLEKCYEKREKVVLHITFLKNCRTFNVFPKFIHVTYIKRRLLKNVLHKRSKEKKKLELHYISE